MSGHDSPPNDRDSTNSRNESDVSIHTDDIAETGASNGHSESLLDTTSDSNATPSGQANPPVDASQGLFDNLLNSDPIFQNKDVLRPSYTPNQLPHRDDQINDMATVLVGALRGETPSNILIYGKTGTGKTASAKFVSNELETTSEKYAVPCEVEYINCEVTDTQYRVLAQLANTFIEANEHHIEDRLNDLRELHKRADTNPVVLDDTDFASIAGLEDRISALEADLADFDPVPMTGWPTDRVYSAFFNAVDYHERVVVIMLDEIDKLVEKSGDDTLYNLSRMNSELDNSRVSIMGISNDLKFTEFLDPRVRSSLGEEEIVFPPYDDRQGSHAGIALD
jgi:cell division control protein 6